MTDTTAETKKPAKAPMPSADFELELVAGSAKSAATDAKATKGELLMISPDLIDEIPGFNVRVETPDYKEHVETIKKSIIANGFYANKPLAAYVVKEDGKSRFKVTDGHTRLRAAKDAIFEGAEIAAIPVVVKPQTQTAEDLMVALVQDNEGRPLNPYERAIVVKRLEGFGWDNPTIATRLGITERYVGDLKVLAGAPAKVRDMVLKGKVSPTEAIKQLRRDAGKAADVLADAVKSAEASGKKKATAKNVKQSAAETTEDSGDEGGANVVDKNGKRITTLKVTFKQSDIVEKDVLRPYMMFNDAAWWDWVDDKKSHMVINETTKIEVTITQPTPAEEAEDESETEGGEDEGASVDHAAGDTAEEEDNGGL